MSSMTPHVISAIGFEQIIPVVFVLFGIISWIVNLLREKKQKAERPVRRAPAQRDDSLQNEIDIFLQEVTGQRGNQNRPAAPAKPVARPPVRTRVTPESARPRKTEQPKPIHKKLGGDIASREGPGSGDLGQGLTQHVQQHMKSHSIRQETEQRLGHNVNEGVLEHLGKSSTSRPETPAIPAGPTMIDEVHRLLSNPQTMGQAVVLNEILSPPRSRRR